MTPSFCAAGRVLAALGLLSSASPILAAETSRPASIGVALANRTEALARPERVAAWLAVR